MSVLLAKPWMGQDPTGWWMSEKLDGVRAIWRDGAFWSRNGKPFHAPAWFRRRIPEGRSLDGELWAGRGVFDKTVSIVRSHSLERWEEITYRVFDLPRSGEPFEKRQKMLADLLDGREFVDLVPQTLCLGPTHLTEFTDEIVNFGGEGAMLREHGSLYEGKRSGTLLKVKRFLDSEAEVVAHLPGKGKHKGRLGALECVTPDLVGFQVGTGFTDLEREDPPKIGSKITVRYQELTKDGVPRFPVFIAVRDYE